MLHFVFHGNIKSWVTIDPVKLFLAFQLCIVGMDDSTGYVIKNGARLGWLNESCWRLGEGGNSSYRGKLKQSL